MGTEIGASIKAARKKSGLSQESLGKAIGRSRDTIRRWEQGATHPSTKEVTAICEVTGQVIAAVQSARLDSKEKMEIPVISMRTPACAGSGNGLDSIALEAEEIYLIDRDEISIIDDLHKPFGVYVEGDSMEEQDVHDGDIAVINPAEDVLDGDVALVSWKGMWSIKGIEYLPDGGIKLRAGKQQYERIIPADMAEDEQWFKILGKVVYSQPRGRRPRRFI